MPQTPDSLSIFLQTSAAIFLEAMPFLLLGALVSGFFESFVPSERIHRHAPKGQFTGILFGLALGTILPTCECGVVPIVRRMLKKGVPAQTAFSYMLAAPVVNPVVLLSTALAFKAEPSMVALRAGIVCLIAAIVAAALADLPAEQILRKGPAPARGCGHEHGAEDQEGEACACRAPDAPPLIPRMSEILAGEQAPYVAPPAPAFSVKLTRALSHATDDFLFAGQYLLLGAFASAAFKTFLPYSLLLDLESNLFLSVAAMQGLAVLLSVCSEADAFVAVSFVGFPAAAKLAFITLGPMLDLKLLFMYTGAFRRAIVFLLAVLPPVLVYMFCVGYGLWR
jgi:uncharacterized membrane protein YraQ (UPF0718 family)